MRTLESEARRINQTMIKKTQIMETTKKLCTRKLLESLQESLQEMKRENEEKPKGVQESIPISSAPQDVIANRPIVNPRYKEALEAKNVE